MTRPDLAIHQARSALEISLTVPTVAQQVRADVSEVEAEPGIESNVADPVPVKEQDGIFTDKDPVVDMRVEDVHVKGIIKKDTRQKTTEDRIDHSAQESIDLNHVTVPGVPQNIAEPDLLFNPPPTYPRLSRKRSEEGLVLLDVLIVADGTVTDILITSSSGYPRLDRSAVETISEWRFRPATRNERPIAVRRMIPIVFKLR